MKNKFIWQAVFYFLLFLITATHSYAIQKSRDPILTPIMGLTINSNPGALTLTNNSGKDISVSKMLLSFNLDQANVTSLWGNPWLNWMPKPIAKKSRDLKTFQFINQANLPNSVLRSGDTITVNYTPDPWNNPNAPRDVQLFNMVYPLNPAPITTTTSYQGGVNTISITNASDQSLSLDGAQLRLDYKGSITSSIWGTPWGNWSVTQGQPNYVISAGTANKIPARGLLTLSFNGDNQPISNVQLWVQELETPTNKGEINIDIPATPVGVSVNPQVTLRGPSFPNGTTLIGTWGQPLIQKSLQAGSYALSAPELTTPDTSYIATIDPNPVVVSGTQPIPVKLTYEVKKLGKLSLNVGPEPSLGLQNPQIKITGPEFPSGITITSPWNSTFFVCPGGASSCPGIKEGDYTVNAPKIYSATDAYIATLPSSVKVALGETTQVDVNYQELAKATFTTTIMMPSNKIKKTTKKVKETIFNVTFTNQSGFAFTKQLIQGTNQVSLPINDTYTITAPTIPGYTPTITPSSITVSAAGTPNVTINYQPGNTTKFVVYYGGWEGMLYNLKNLPSSVSALNLSFANITSNYKVDTVPSGSLTNIPAPNVRMQPTYINWTTFKYSRPNTKVLLAVGGATYSAIWNSVLTPTSAETIAKNIAEVINQPYPVYKGEFSYAADLLGNVSIDGVDLDIETGSRLSTQVTNNVILLTQNLKKYLNPGKIITFAGFSVGADPNDSRCTVQGSVHCGEDIQLLQNLGSTFEWVNVMAYDAGQEYATSKYQIALANYAGYIGKTKTILGLDLQNQWPGFFETASQLATKAAWQKQNGYAGAMLWGVGVENNPTKEQQYVEAIHTALQ